MSSIKTYYYMCRMCGRVGKYSTNLPFDPGTCNKCESRDFRFLTEEEYKTIKERWK